MARLSISLQDETLERLNECIPSGVRSTVVDTLICTLCEHVEENGPGVIGLILSGNCELGIKLKEGVQD